MTLLFDFSGTNRLAASFNMSFVDVMIHQTIVMQYVDHADLAYNILPVFFRKHARTHARKHNTKAGANDQTSLRM